MDFIRQVYIINMDIILHYEAIKICKLLNISEPQIEFTTDPIKGDPKILGLYKLNSDKVIIRIHDNGAPLGYIKTLAHELRHKYQHQYGKKIIKKATNKLTILLCLHINYSEPHIYSALPNEIDAEAFARKYIQIFYNDQFTLSNWHGSKKVFDKIVKRMKKIDNEFEERKIDNYEDKDKQRN